ncbi:MAG: NUDIX domain-containing protein [Bacteroidaceae bacterium]|nr:NUDIX domain-containing protein [Bacteroidaceae bacterium]
MEKEHRNPEFASHLPSLREGQGVGSHPLHLFHFCPKCGSPRFVEHNEKSKQCMDCGFTYYINPSAATVALIERRTEQGAEWLCVRRAKEPAKGTLDLPGGFSDLYETSEQGVVREVKEETGLDVERVEFLFSIPNQYVYSGFTVHTMDMFYRCHVADGLDSARAADDAGEVLWLRPEDIRPEDFGLISVRQGVRLLLAKRQKSGL